jgi:hypothetical protein
MNNMKTQTMKAKQISKTGRKNKQWMRNPDQLKTPKKFLVEMIRNKDGSFFIPGNGAYVSIKRNADTEDIIPVDVRDFACELRRSKIITY